MTTPFEYAKRIALCAAFLITLAITALVFVIRIGLALIPLLVVCAVIFFFIFIILLL